MTHFRHSIPLLSFVVRALQFVRCAIHWRGEPDSLRSARTSSSGAHGSLRSARTSTSGTQLIGDARMTAHQVRAPQLQACYPISVICGARITVREVRAPQLLTRNSLVGCT